MANLGFFKEVMAEAVDRAKGAVVEKTQAAVGKAREMVGLVDASAEPSAPPPEPSILDELNQYCSLTLKQVRSFSPVGCLVGRRGRGEERQRKGRGEGRGEGCGEGEGDGGTGGFLGGTLGASPGAVYSGRAEPVLLAHAEAVQSLPEPSILDELNQRCSLTQKQSILVFPSPIKLSLSFSSTPSLPTDPNASPFLCSHRPSNSLSPTRSATSWPLAGERVSTSCLIGFTRQIELIFEPILFLCSASIPTAVTPSSPTPTAGNSTGFLIGFTHPLLSTGFLIGFTRQLKMMFDPIRIGAAIVFVLSLVLTLVAALYVQDALLTLLCIVVQACSLIWYSLSYIPFAQLSSKPRSLSPPPPSPLSLSFSIPTSP
ncbi:unnamed protein product [Closterium sp. NIES-65]|nr:unnamed protein product [Closterium sp. NIES-65]